jgi:hypothetical protein
MAHKKPGASGPSLDNRFTFVSDAVAPGNQATFKPALYEVEDRASGAPRCLKLWRKTGTPVDADLRELWRHEMRQLQRVMAYPGARDVIVDILEFVEDTEYFGVLLERAGQPLAAKNRRLHRQHWLQDLTTVRARTLLWRNMRRVTTALGIVHRQGLVHGKLSGDVVMTEGAEETDFQLGGFEWSLRLGADTADRSHAELGAEGAAQRPETYSFAEDWRAFGLMIAECLGVRIKASGEFVSSGPVKLPIALNGSERALLKRLTFPTRFDLLDAPAVVRSIDDIVANIAQATMVQPGTFILGFTTTAGLGEAVFDASNGEIAVDEFNQQLDWIRADLDTGAKLLVPRPFDPASDALRVVTEAMLYRLRAFRHDDGSAAWDIGVCVEIKVRANALKLASDVDHVIDQSITVAKLPTEAQQLRARLGPDVLDWSLFAGAGTEPAPPNRTEGVRQALVLVQVAEAVVKALECYPIEILDAKSEQGRRFVTIRAEPANERDHLAQQVGMSETATALKRLFEEDARDQRSPGARGISLRDRQRIAPGWTLFLEDGARHRHRTGDRPPPAQHQSHRYARRSCRDAGESLACAALEPGDTRRTGAGGRRLPRSRRAEAEGACGPLGDASFLFRGRPARSWQDETRHRNSAAALRHGPLHPSLGQRAGA